MNRFRRSIVWLRRDLRLDDNAAFSHACAQSEAVAAVFVLDPKLLRSNRIGPPIVQFFFHSLAELRSRLRELGSDLAILEGDAEDEIPRFAQRLDAQPLFFNDDYEPSALRRDARVENTLRSSGITVERSLDHVYFGANEVTQADGTPYRVFTPYKRRWLARFDDDPRMPFTSVHNMRRHLLPTAEFENTLDIPKPEDYGRASSDRYPVAGEMAANRLLQAFISERLDAYERDRNFPAIGGTSRLSPHLRTGTIGIRRCIAAGSEVPQTTGSKTWLDELLWRDFYQQILRHFPRVESEPFIEAAKRIRWRDDEQGWRAWRTGETGYPIVDAAMRQLNETGWMHNRLRMIVASFLSKHLLIDYRRGERYFEQHLVDADLAANNGGWQWSSSTGTDPVPYFRVFNPVLQGKRFDPDGAFVREWLPVLAQVPKAYVHEPWTMPPLVAEHAHCVPGRDYPLPIVDHILARTRALATFGHALALAK